MAVKVVVDTNRILFEQKAYNLNNVQEHIEMNGPMKDALAEICPETEQESFESAEEQGEREDSEVYGKLLPDLLSPVEALCIFESISNMAPKEHVFILLWSLNEKQSKVLHRILMFTESTWKVLSKPLIYFTFLSLEQLAPVSLI